MTQEETLRVGKRVEDLCRACRSVRAHTVLVLDAAGRPERVLCDTCRSEHNYRGGGGGGGASVREERRPAMTSEPDRDVETSPTGDLEALLRRVLREESGFAPAEPAPKWQGGEMILRPGKAGLQEKRLPLDALFRKIVAIRNKLRVLEQQVNTSDLSDDAKLRLQGYITGCYGSLTSFNVLFASEDDRFKGASSED